jgi:hypothetical protein
MKDLTQGSVTKHLLHMSAFMAVSMVVQTLYLLADLFWVGRLGKEAIAAVGVAGNLTMIVLALTQMLGVGTTALISQAAGRKDQPHAELAFNQSCMMSILIALALGIVGFLSMDAYANSLSADATTAVLAESVSALVPAGIVAPVPTRLDRLGFASDRHCSGAGDFPGNQRRSEHGPRPVPHFRMDRISKTRRNRRRARDLYLHSRRGFAHHLVLREEISLSAFPISALPPPDKNLERDAAHRRARGG